MSTMARQQRIKLNQLQHVLPEGLPVDSNWLQKRGYSRQLIAKYLQHGWLASPVRSVYWRDSTTFDQKELGTSRDIAAKFTRSASHSGRTHSTRIARSVALSLKDGTIKNSALRLGTTTHLDKQIAIEGTVCVPVDASIQNKRTRNR